MVRPPDDLEARGRASIKAGSKSFALASRVLPPNLRNDASMLYAWCRHCDDVVDGQEMGHGQVEGYREGQADRLATLRQHTADAFAGRDVPPEFVGMARVFATHAIPHVYADHHLNGFQMDVDQRVYESIEDVLDYSYHVAGVVGVMMAHVMGVRDPATLDRASDLGLAFQLTNIARDVIDDAVAGRVFVPEALLHRHGAPDDPMMLARPENRPAAHAAALDLLDVAESYYASARIGIEALPPRCAWAITAALNVYREIGVVLRREGPEAWQGRVGAGGGRKLWLAVQSGRRGKPSPLSRDGLYTRPAA